MESDDNPLPEDVLRLIVAGHTGTATSVRGEKEAEKVANHSRPANADTNVTRSRRPDDVDDNLEKIMARRSHGVSIGMVQEDFFLGHRVQMAHQEPVTGLDFGPEVDDGTPGAYSGTPGQVYDRVRKGNLPRELRGNVKRISYSTTSDLAKLPTADHATDDTDHLTDDNPIEKFTVIMVEPSFKKERQAGTETKRKCRRRTLQLISGLLLVCAAIAVPMVILIGKSGKDKPVSGFGDPTLEAVVMPVPNMTQSTLESLKYPDSVQSWAYSWVKKKQAWDSYPPWRQQQLFAVACIFYAFNGLSWKPTVPSRPIRWMRRNADECTWQPTDFCRGTGEVTSLDLSWVGGLKGSALPAEVSFLPHLEIIDLTETKLNGALNSLLPLNVTPNPLPALRVLKLAKNSLSGSIPTSLARLTNLTHLDLSDNDLTSTIPTELSLLAQLTSVNLAGNDFSGEIPEALRELPNSPSDETSPPK